MIQKKRRSFLSCFKKTIALSMVFLIEFANLSSSGLAQVSAPLPSEEGFDFKRLISADSGKIITADTHKPQVIYIQTAHAHAEANQKISEMVKRIQSEWGATIVLAEGASSVLDPQLLRFFDDKKKQLQMIEALNEAGWLTAADQMLAEGLNIRVDGLEHPAFYRESLKAFVAATEEQSHETARLRPLQKKIDERFKRIAPSDVLGLMLLRQSAEGEAKNHAEWLEKLLQLAETRLGLSFLNSDLQGEYPQLVRFAAIQKAESIFVVSRYEQELQQLRRLAQDSLIAEKIRRLIEGEKSIRKDWELLLQDSEAQVFPFQDFPQLHLFALNQILRNEIDAETLIQESKAVEEEIYKTVLGSTQARVWMSFFQQLSDRGNLSRLKLDRKAWQRLQSIETGDALRQTAAWRFYELAEARERGFLDRVKSKIKRNSRPVILVTGGFHGDGMELLLKAEAISFVSIRPQISQIPDETIYFQKIIEAAHLELSPLSLRSEARAAQGWNLGQSETNFVERSYLAAGGIPDQFLETPYALDRLPLARRSESRVRNALPRLILSTLFGFMMIGMTACTSVSKPASDMRSSVYGGGEVRRAVAVQVQSSAQEEKRGLFKRIFAKKDKKKNLQQISRTAEVMPAVNQEGVEEIIEPILPLVARVDGGDFSSDTSAPNGLLPSLFPGVESETDFLRNEDESADFTTLTLEGNLTDRNIDQASDPVWGEAQAAWFSQDAVVLKHVWQKDFLEQAGVETHDEKWQPQTTDEILKAIQSGQADEQQMVRALLELGSSSESEAFHFLKDFLFELKNAPLSLAAQETAPSVNSDSYVPFLKKQNSKMVEAVLYAMTQVSDKNFESLGVEDRQDLALWSMRVAQAFPENQWMVMLSAEMFGRIAAPEDKKAWAVFWNTYFSNPVAGAQFDGTRESFFVLNALADVVKKADADALQRHRGYWLNTLTRALRSGNLFEAQVWSGVLANLGWKDEVEKVFSKLKVPLPSGGVDSAMSDSFYDAFSVRHDLKLLLETLAGGSQELSQLERQLLLRRLVESGENVSSDDLFSAWKLFFERGGWSGLLTSAQDAPVADAVANYAQAAHLDPQVWSQTLTLLTRMIEHPSIRDHTARLILDQLKYVRHYEDRIFENPDLESSRADFKIVKEPFMVSLKTIPKGMLIEYARRTLTSPGDYLPGFVLEVLPDDEQKSFLQLLQLRNPAAGLPPLNTADSLALSSSLDWIPTESNISNQKLQEAINFYEAGSFEAGLSSAASIKIKQIKESVGKVLSSEIERSLLLMQKDADPAVRRALARFAPEMTWNRLPDLRNALEALSHDSDALVRATSLPALYKAGHPKLAEIFSEVLRNENAHPLESYFALQGIAALKKPEFFPVVADWIEKKEVPSLWQMLFPAHLSADWDIARQALKGMSQNNLSDTLIAATLEQKTKNPGWSLQRYFLWDPLKGGKDYPAFSFKQILVSLPMAFLAYWLAHFAFGLFGKMFGGKQTHEHHHHSHTGHDNPEHDSAEHDHGDGDEGEVQIERSGKLKGTWWMIIAAVLIQVGGGFLEYHLSFGNALIRGDAWHMWAHVAGFILPIAGAYKDWFDTGSGEVKTQKARAMANALSGLVIVAIAGIMIVEGVLKFLYFYPVAATAAAMTVIFIGAVANLLAIPLISKAFPKPLPCPGCGQTHGSGEGGIKIMILHLMQDLADSGAAFVGTLAVSLGFFGVDGFLVMILGYVFGKAGFKATAANLVKWKQIRDQEKEQKRIEASERELALHRAVQELQAQVASIQSSAPPAPLVVAPTPSYFEPSLFELDAESLKESAMSVPIAMQGNVWAWIPEVNHGEDVWENDDFSTVLAGVSEGWAGLAGLPAPENKGPDEDFHLRSMVDEIAHGDLNLARSAVVFDGRLLNEKRVDAWKKFFGSHRYIPIYEIGGTNHFQDAVDHYAAGQDFQPEAICGFLKKFQKGQPKVWMIFKNSAPLPPAAQSSEKPATPSSAKPVLRRVFSVLPAPSAVDMGGIFSSQITGFGLGGYAHDHVHGILPFDSDLAKRVGIESYPPELQGQVYAAILAHGICPAGYPNKNLTKVRELVQRVVAMNVTEAGFNPSQPDFIKSWSDFTVALQIHASATIPVLILDGGRVKGNKEAYRSWLASAPKPSNLVIVQIGEPQIAIQNDYIPQSFLSRFKVLSTFDANGIEDFAQSLVPSNILKPEFLWVSQLPIPHFHPKRAEVRGSEISRRNFLAGLGALLALGFRTNAYADSNSVQVIEVNQVWQWASRTYVAQLAQYDAELERLKKQDGGIELRLTENQYQNNTLQITPAKILDLPELASDTLGYLLKKIFGEEKVGREIQIAMLEHLRFERARVVREVVDQVFQLAIDIWKTEQERLLVEKVLLPDLEKAQEGLPQGAAFERANPRIRLELERELTAARAKSQTLATEAVQKQVELGQILNGPDSKARIRVQFDSAGLLEAAQRMKLSSDIASRQPQVLAAQAMVRVAEKAGSRELKSERAALNVSAFFPSLNQANSERPAFLQMPGSVNLTVALNQAQIQLNRARAYLNSVIQGSRKKIEGSQAALNSARESYTSSLIAIKAADQVKQTGAGRGKAFEPAPRADFELKIEDMEASYLARVQAAEAAAQVLRNYFILKANEVGSRQRSELRKSPLSFVRSGEFKIWERIAAPFKPEAMLLRDATQALYGRAKMNLSAQAKNVVILDGSMIQQQDFSAIAKLKRPVVIYFDPAKFTAEQLRGIRLRTANQPHIFLLVNDDPLSIIITALQFAQGVEGDAANLRRFLAQYVNLQKEANEFLAWIGQDRAIFNIPDNLVRRKILFGKAELKRLTMNDDRLRIFLLLLDAPELFAIHFGSSKMNAGDFLKLLTQSLAEYFQIERTIRAAA